MAISTQDSILAMLKTYYKKEGLENLLFRNSPVVKEITKERVEGKTQNFSAMYGRGGAVGGDFTKAKKAAATTARAVEFAVVPGQIFSVYSMNAKEVQASKTNAGAYMKVGGAKMFAAQEAFRKTLAASFYGRGYGELCTIGSAVGATITQNKPVEIEIPTHAIMAVDIGTRLAIKEKVDSNSSRGEVEITEINGNKIKVVCRDKTINSIAATDVLCLDGSMDGEGNPILPIGLGGWLPTVGKRKSGTWTTYIAKPLYNVKRNINPDRLAGAFVDGSGDAKVAPTLKKLIQKARRQGSMADLIVMNDETFLKLSEEIESTNSFFTQTSTTSKKEATTGMSKLAAAFSTNYIENIYDDPYCPEGAIYVLDKAYVKLWSYTNVDVENDNVAGNAAGKADPMEANDKGAEEKPNGLIIDDYLNIQQGEDSIDGPATNVSLMFYGTFVVENPSVMAVGITKDFKEIEA